jgi:hypothetical protein
MYSSSEHALKLGNLLYHLIALAMGVAEDYFTDKVIQMNSRWRPEIRVSGVFLDQEQCLEDAPASIPCSDAGSREWRRAFRVSRINFANILFLKSMVS